MIGGTWQSTVSDRPLASSTAQIAAVLVVLPVFLQAPWVRVHPFSAALFTAVLLASGLILNLRDDQQEQQDLGALLVGFSGSWLAGCVFWGWMRTHPILHLPVEAFALPLALAGLGSRWRLAAGFYLASLVGTACTDFMMAVTGVMPFWPQALSAPLDQASQLLHAAALQLMQPWPLMMLGLAAAVLLRAAQLMKRQARQGGFASETLVMAAAVLTTTLWVDGLFLVAAFLQPGLSGLI